MWNYHFDHVHLRSSDPEAMARFFETLFGAEVTRGIYPPGTLYAGHPRISLRLGGQRVLIAPPPSRRSDRPGAALPLLRCGAYRPDGR